MLLIVAMITLQICVSGILVIALQVQTRKLRDARREIASWKLAVESYEKEKGSW